MAPSLTGALQETLSLFEASGEPRTTVEIADRLDLGRRSTYDRLERLVEEDRLETKKVGANARVWWRPAPDADATGTGPTATGPAVGDVLDDVDVGVFVLDEDFDVAWVNEAIERYFGLDREGVVGEDKRRLVEDRIVPVVAESDAFRETVLATYSDNTYAKRFQCWVTPDDGRVERRLEHRSRPIESGPYAGGRIELYYDVTERERLGRRHRETSHEFESLVDAVEEYAIFTLDPEGRVRTWNAGAERIKGYCAEEIVGEHFSVFYPQADRTAGVPERNLSTAASTGSVEDEGWRLRADGSTFWAKVTITAIRDDDGEVERYVKITRDMTERKRAETERELRYGTTRAIAEAETVEEGLDAALRAVCEVADWPYAEAWLPTDEGGLRRADADYCEAAFEGFATYSEDVTFERGEGLPGRVWATGESEWASDISAGCSEEYPRIEQALDAGFRSSFGVPILADGDVVAVLTFLVTELRESDERLVETTSSVASELGALVARRQLEARIERERDLVDRILDTSPVGIVVLDDEGEVSRTNEHARETLELPEAADSYTTANRTVYDAEGDRVSSDEHPALRALETGEPVFDGQVEVELPSGGHRWLSVNAAPVLDADGEVERVIATSEDITRIKEQARRLERQQEQLRAELSDVFDRISDGFFGLDSDLGFTFVNDRAEELLGEGRPFLIGHDVRDALEITDRFEAALEEALETQEPVTVEGYYPPLDVWFENRIYPSETGLSVYFRDITERKERERELEQSRRRYRTLVENFPNGAVGLVDEDLRYVVIGGTPIEGVDATPEELEGTPVGETLPLEVADVMVSRYEAALDGETRTGEVDVNGRSYLIRTFPVRDDDGDVFAAMGMSQDITDRKRVERERETQLRQQQVVSDFGQQALEGGDLDALLADAAELVADTLDNDYCKVLELDADAEELLLRQGVGWDEGIVGSATVSSVEADSQAAYTLATEAPVVVSDLETETRFGGPDLLTDHDVRSGISVIIGPIDDPWGILGTHDRSRRRYTENDANFVRAIANVLSTAIERSTYQYELERQHQELATLNNLNRVVQDTSNAVIDQSTREEIEATVCERLADSGSYLFAWIGEVDTDSRTVDLRAEAGVEGYLAGVTISVDPDDEHSEGPTGTALRTGETQVCHDVRVDPQYGPWREHAEEHRVGSSAAIPIAYEGTVYGVLNVYAARTNAFDDRERDVLAQLGELVGHAIAATDRKRALMNEELAELEFQVRDVFASVGVPVEANGTITLDNVVPVRDDEFLVYGTATADAVDAVNELVEALPYWASVRFDSDDRDERASFEIRATDPPILSTLASAGGDVDGIVIEDGTMRMTLRFPPSVDVRRIIDTVEASFPDAEMLRRRQVTRTSNGHRFARQHIAADLTDAQRATLQAAYHAGFFAWPRDVSGEDVAESMDVAPPTFHQHLRKAERKVFDALFSTTDEATG
jgi:PAS domain S-box-containing protein